MLRPLPLLASFQKLVPDMITELVPDMIHYCLLRGWGRGWKTGSRISRLSLLFVRRRFALYPGIHGLVFWLRSALVPSLFPMLVAFQRTEFRISRRIWTTGAIVACVIYYTDVCALIHILLKHQKQLSMIGVKSQQHFQAATYCNSFHLITLTNTVLSICYKKRLKLS